MIDIAQLTLEKLDKNGLLILIDRATQEGWNPGLHDADVFWKTDPDGYYGYFYNQQLIAGGAIVSYQQEFGFMGLFIVHPDFRGQGIGRKLWYQRRDLLVSRLHKNAAIGMDGVVAMQPFYEAGGFTIAFRDERYECKGEKIALSPHISTVQKEDFENIMAYDKDCFGFKREEFLQNWLAMPQSSSFKYIINNEIQGFAVIRKCHKGYKAGPLFADTHDIAEELYKACLNYAAGELIYLDIPTVNKKAVALVAKFNANYVFECARMYYNDAPNVAINKIYGITTFELG